MIKQPINKRRRFVEDSADASHSTLVEKVEEPTVTETLTTTSEPNDDDEITATDRLDFERGLSRRKRKTLKKQEKFERRKGLLQRITETKESMNKNKKQQQKQQGIFSFDPMSKLLQNEETSDMKKTEKPKKESNEVAKKNKKMKNEIEQFTNVLNHPVFQSNPLQVIQQHLKNKMKTLPQQSNDKKTTPQPTTVKKNTTPNPGHEYKKKQARKAKFNTKRSKESFDKNVESVDKAGKRKRND